MPLLTASTQIATGACMHVPRCELFGHGLLPGPLNLSDLPNAREEKHDGVHGFMRACLLA